MVRAEKVKNPTPQKLFSTLNINCYFISAHFVQPHELFIKSPDRVGKNAFPALTL